MKIFFSVGEPSGDIHGANLIRQLRMQQPDAELVGYGGPKMAAAGCRLHEDLTRLAVMWFARVLVNLHKFLRLLLRANRYFRTERPDAVVLIDYPGFNWWIARRAKAHGIPVFYYGTPQMWAWAAWRVKKMRRLVDHVLCKLPFEVDWYQKRGCNATYVGHPFFDEVRQHRLDEPFVVGQRQQAGRLVAILPGSRTQEVTANLPMLLQAARQIHRHVPDTRFAIAAFCSEHSVVAGKFLAESGLNAEAECPIFVQKTPELIHAAECCLAVSGSVSLELLHHLKPTVIVYRVSKLAFRIQGWFRRVKYITLVNLLAASDLFPDDLSPFDPQQPDAAEVPFPEYLTCEDRDRQIAQHAIDWLTDPAAMRDRVDRLTRLRDAFGSGGASQRAAQHILSALPDAPAKIPRPHFLAPQRDHAA